VINNLTLMEGNMKGGHPAVIRRVDLVHMEAERCTFLSSDNGALQIPTSEYSYTWAGVDADVISVQPWDQKKPQ
jgi:hypothetical protein